MRSMTSKASCTSQLAILVFCIFKTISYLAEQTFNLGTVNTSSLTTSTSTPTSSLGNNNNATNSILTTNFTENLILDYESCKHNTAVAPENWCLDADKVPRYARKEGGDEGEGEDEDEDWPPRNIQHYTHTGYEKCLASKTVVFIGDSRTRYQFMHLANYLKTNKRMRCQDYTLDNSSSLPITPDHECFLINEKQGDTKGGMREDWLSWYKDSTMALESDEQSNLCDCYRAPSFEATSTYENRFIKRSTPFGEINLIYLQNFMNSISMSEEYPPFSSFDSTPKRCKTGECGLGNRTDVFQGSLNDTIWNILPQLNTTHAFVNVGWNDEWESDYSCMLQEFEHHHLDIKVHHINNPTTRWASRHKAFERKMPQCNSSDVLDRTITNTHLPKTWYWDNVHVLSILNEEYNHQLLETICPIKKS